MLFQMVLNNAKYNVGLKQRVFCWVRFESFERARFLSRDLQTAPQIVHICKGCIYDDKKV